MYGTLSSWKPFENGLGSVDPELLMEICERPGLCHVFCLFHLATTEPGFFCAAKMSRTATDVVHGVD